MIPQQEGILSASQFSIVAPLSEFSWDGDGFSMPGLCSIVKREAIPQQSECRKLLSDLAEADQRELSAVSHWLVLERDSNELLSAASKINIFLLALWLVVPTRTQVRFRFEFSNGSNDGSGTRSVARMLDRFQFIESEVHDSLSTEQLTEALTYVEPMRSLYTARKRLWNSLVLTFYGCTTIHWQAVVLCFSAAAEGLLTYKKGPGITARLAKSFACLTKATQRERDAAYRAFVHSYNIRGDIMHGRAGYLQDKGENLKELIQLSDLIRALWKTVLLSPAIVVQLEATDIERERWFQGLENGYHPPKAQSLDQQRISSREHANA